MVNRDAGGTGGREGGKMDDGDCDFDWYDDCVLWGYARKAKRRKPG